MHCFFVNEGLREGLDNFERDFDFLSFGGKPARLRPIRFYDLQFEEEYMHPYLNELRGGADYSVEERRFKDSIDYKWTDTTGFQSGTMRRLTDLAVNVFGKIPGIEVVPWNSIPAVPHLIQKNCINTFVFGISRDRKINTDAYGTEEWL